AFFASCGAEQDDDQFESDHHHTGTTNKIDFDTYNQKISYCIGRDHARACYQVYNGAQARDAFNILEIKAGMVDYLSDKDLRIDFLKKDSLLDLYLLPNGEVDELAVSKNDASYCIGMDEAFILVSSLVGRKIDQEVEVDFILKGIIEGFSGTNDPSIPYMEARRNLDQYYGDLNLENGKSFLAENRQIQGVIETESGLQ